MSSSIKTNKASTGYYPGNKVPNIIFTGLEGQQLDLSDYKGKKVVLNFWATYDAPSRANNVRLYNYLKENTKDIEFISVAFDENVNICRRTVLLDKIDINSQFCDANGTDSEIYKLFKLNKGFKSYLIDENGVIEAIDLSIDKLQKQNDISITKL